MSIKTRINKIAEKLEPKRSRVIFVINAVKTKTKKEVDELISEKKLGYCFTHKITEDEFDTKVDLLNIFIGNGKSNHLND